MNAGPERLSNPRIPELPFNVVLPDESGTLARALGNALQKDAAIPFLEQFLRDASTVGALNGLGIAISNAGEDDWSLGFFALGDWERDHEARECAAEQAVKEHKAL